MKEERGGGQGRMYKKRKKQMYPFHKLQSLVSEGKAGLRGSNSSTISI